MTKILLTLVILATAFLAGCGLTTDPVTAAQIRGAEAGLKDRAMRPACPRVVPEWSPLIKETPATLEAYRKAYLEVCVKRAQVLSAGRPE